MERNELGDQIRADLSGALVSELGGVSCPAASACIGVGDFVNGASKPQVLAETWNGTGWTIQPVPNPSTTRGFLNAVSCSSATDCTAVGSYLNGSAVNVPLAERWNGTSWTLQNAPSPQVSTNAALEAVSCPSATSCMAVGRFFSNVTNHWMRLAEQWDGTNWTIKTTQNPSGETFSTLNGVACASSTACTVVGGYSTKTGAFAADTLLAEQFNGATWVIEPTPVPGGTTFATFTGVSCSAAAECTAAGGTSTTGRHVARRTFVRARAAGRALERDQLGDSEHAQPGRRGVRGGFVPGRDLVHGRSGCGSQRAGTARRGPPRRSRS